MDVVADLKTLASGQVMEIKPPSTEEWVVHNILVSDKAGLERTDGGVGFEFDEVTEAGGWNAQFFHVTSAQYLKVRNKLGASMHAAYDGIKTKG